MVRTDHEPLGQACTLSVALLPNMAIHLPRLGAEAQSAEALAASPFLAVVISPRAGRGGMTVDCQPEQQAAWSPSDWRPGGSDISVQLAAVALVYHTPAFAALLEFLDGWTACRVAPWSWRTPAPAAAASSAGGTAGSRRAAAQGPPPLPDSPEMVPQMVLQSFAAHGVPTLGTLSLEGSTLEVHCPGIAVQLPYEHNAQFDIVRMGGSHSQAAAAAGAAHGGRPPADPATAANPAAANAAAAARDDGKPPLRYALTVTMQNLQLLAVGEDASGFLQVRVLWSVCGVAHACQTFLTRAALRHYSSAPPTLPPCPARPCVPQGRVARRMDASAYVDVFSYLSAESRHVVASRLVPARVTFDASRRTFTDEGQVSPCWARSGCAGCRGQRFPDHAVGAVSLRTASLLSWLLAVCPPALKPAFPACGVQEVDSLEAALREMELASMAKVRSCRT